jgi:hypothetical protein
MATPDQRMTKNVLVLTTDADGYYAFSQLLTTRRQVRFIPKETILPS